MVTQRNRKPNDPNPQTGIEYSTIVADVLRDWPETIPVFLKRRLGCVGCELSVFDTVADVARIYNFDTVAFLEELLATIQTGDPGIEKAA